jgi:hypothetical protein
LATEAGRVGEAMAKPTNNFYSQRFVTARPVLSEAEGMGLLQGLEIIEATKNRK